MTEDEVRRFTRDILAKHWDLKLPVDVEDIASQLGLRLSRKGRYEAALELGLAFFKDDALARLFARELLIPQLALKVFGIETREKRRAYDVPVEAMYIRLLDEHAFLAVELGVVPSLVERGLYKR